MRFPWNQNESHNSDTLCEETVLLNGGMVRTLANSPFLFFDLELTESMVVFSLFT